MSVVISFMEYKRPDISCSKLDSETTRRGSTWVLNFYDVVSMVNKSTYIPWKKEVNLLIN